MTAAPLPRLALLFIAITALLAVAGPFGTLATLRPVQRLVFWGAIVAVNLFAWRLWEQLAEPPRIGRVRTRLVGAIGLSTLIPLEIAALFAAFGPASTIAYLPTFVNALAVTALLMPALLREPNARLPDPAPPP